MSDRDVLAWIDLSKVPFCCIACGRRTVWVDAEPPIPTHYLCQTKGCGAAYAGKLVGSLLSPGLMSISRQ